MTHTTNDTEEILAQLSPAPGRWFFGLVVQYALAAVLLYIAIVFPPRELVFHVLLVGLAAGTIFLAERGRRVKRMTVYLGREGLWDSEGRAIARIDQIKSVERGALAFKPSNGFLLRMTTAPGRVWVPGLWWRVGKNVGVGGTTPAGASKFMAELVATLVKEHQAQD